jgi:hypothetical protein
LQRKVADQKNEITTSKEGKEELDKIKESSEYYKKVTKG